MAEQLTAQQRQAVEHRGGNLLVSAAAGSGKTKVLVDRLLSYLTEADNPGNLDDFLIITYTKAAAAELRGKIAAKLSEKIALDPQNRHLQQQMQRLYLAKISTVHAFCSEILREYAYRLDIAADFHVADENECQELQTQVLEKLLESSYESDAISPDFYAFINSQGFKRDDRAIPEIILQVYNSARCHLNPEQWLDWCVSSMELDDIDDASQTVWGSYLLNDLKAYLGLQITALNRCILAAQADENLKKPVELLQETVNQLAYLAEAKSWSDVQRRKHIDYGRLTFSKKCTDLVLVERIKAIRSSCKKGVDKKLRGFAAENDQLFEDIHRSTAATRGLVFLVKQFSEQYDKSKRIRRVMDFGDLEHRTLDLLLGKSRSGPTAVCAQIAERFREVMVDEYQDSNGVQDAIFEALTRNRHNCFMVGDVKQSIYQFRLADPGIFIEKYNRYHEDSTKPADEGRKILLSSNFRSSGEVIQAVNDVFSSCMSPAVGGLHYGDSEKLYEGAPHDSLSEPAVEFYGIDVQEDTYAEEAAFVAARISSLLDGAHLIQSNDGFRPIRPGDIAILLRSPGSVGGEFLYALEEAGIPCVTGNSIDLLQTEEVSFLHSFLQIINNPLQDIPLIAVLMSRVFGFTADDLAAIRGRNRRQSFYERLCKSGSEKSREFVVVLKELRQEARLYSVSQLLQNILTKISVDSLFSAMENGAERKKNIQMFCQLAADFEAGGRKDFIQFLEYLDTMAEKGLVYSDDQQNTQAVTIMSIHKSKGLEFPVVFLCGLSRTFNQENARAQVLCHKGLGLGLSCADAVNRVRYPTIMKKAIASKIVTESISEEMRVLYVAMTRAKDRLIMTYAAKNLETDISDVATRMDLSGKELMTQNVDCPGSWVLYAVLQRTEAAPLLKFVTKPDMTSYREPHWKIDWIEGKQTVSNYQSSTQESTPLTPELLQQLYESLQFQYGHIAATTAPSKLTATQMKGRWKDQEAAEDTNEASLAVYTFRKPEFAKRLDSPKDIGNAVHIVMQHIDYKACTDLCSIEQEIQRLILERKISAEQGAAVPPQKLAALFSTEIGQKLIQSTNVLREFKFSILSDSSQYGDGLDGEKVLVQGVVDCALLEEDGITVIDFKTDRTTVENTAKIVDRYAGQVQVYAEALARIYKKKIKRKLLYLFDADLFVEV